MITKTDFLNILADAIMSHEGYTATSRSFLNKNPGNIKYVGQAGVTADADNFCVAPDFLTGKALQIHDLTLKLTKYNTIRDIISVYAPPSENNTEAYITSVVTWFHKRNIPVTDTMPITEIVALPLDVVSIALDNLFEPADWASAQGSIDLAAAQMPDFAFTTRYVNRPVLATEFTANPSPMGNLYAVNKDVTQSILLPLDDGQRMSVLFYMTIKTGEAGGVQYGGCAISNANKESAFCNVLFNGSPFAESTSRALFHELIHCLFTLTGFPDTLHDYLVAHSGYAQNTIVDLVAVYADIHGKFVSGTTVAEVATQAVAIVAADKNPADKPALFALLTAVGNLLTKWFKG